MLITSNPRLLIDHTHTTLSGYQTGVQRVVRNICQHAVECKSGFRQVLPIQWCQEEFRFASTPDQQGDSKSNNRASPFIRIVRKIAKWTGRTTKSGSEPSNEAIDFRSGDVLLLPDAYWAFPKLWPTVQKLREIGVKTAVVIYDLIPHTHSEIYGEQGAEGFRAYIRLAYQHADCLLAISDTVRQQLHEHLPDIMGMQSTNIPIRSFQLGADFVDRTGPVRNELSTVFGGSDEQLPYLMVGTIEARKNHSFVLDTMEQLWREFPLRRLCIVGQPGWKGEAVIDRITNHPRFQKQLFWFQNASDAEVLYCYKTAKGVLFPSLTEGFGLPIVEALWHRRETFASDIPIHRETGKNLCHYFPLDDSSHLAMQLLKREVSKESNKSLPPSNIVVPWSVAVQNLIGTIDECLNQPRCTKRTATTSAA